MADREDLKIVSGEFKCAQSICVIDDAGEPLGSPEIAGL
jgi:hypothetical protein